MKKSKLINPAEIINIVTGSFLLITAISTFVSLISLKVIQYYVLAFIVNLFLIILGIGLIIISSLCLAFTKRKTYTSKGEKFCLLTIFLEIIIIALEIVNVLLAIKMYNRVNPMLFFYIFISVATTMFLLVGVKESVVGSKEEIEAKLKPIIDKSIVMQQNNVYVENKITNKNVSFNEQIDRIEKIYNLYQKGILSKEEYETKKNEILSQIK